MDRDYASGYEDLFGDHWWFRARQEEVHAALSSHLGARERTSILDVGCGAGLSFSALDGYGAIVEGLETDASLVSTELRSDRTIYTQPFDDAFDPGKQYELITMLDVLEHIDDETQATRRLRELLAPGGMALLTVPAMPSLWTRHDEVNHHRRRYTRTTLAQALDRAGLQIVEIRYLFRWLVPVKVAIKSAEVVGLGKDVHGRPPGALANGVAHGICRLEALTLGRLPWPFGTSLIALARKPAPAA